MTQHARFRYEPVEGAAALFTDRFVEYLLALHDRLAPSIATVLSRRAEAVRRAVTQGALPGHPARSASPSSYRSSRHAYCGSAWTAASSSRSR